MADETEAEASLLEMARKQYPVLNKLDLGYAFNPRTDRGFMEFWPPGEPGGEDYPRPPSLPIDRPGVEVYDKRARPIDLLGDVVSHHMIEKDKHIKDIYQKFSASIDDRQRGILREQYDYAKKNLNEKRPYEAWERNSGLPAMFRGHPFQQWSRDDNERIYRPEQRALLDSMMEYLTTGKKRQKTIANGEAE